MGRRHVDRARTGLRMDCAQICQTSADFMLRGSPHHAETCGACAEICEAWAKSSEPLGGAEMKACAEACRSCAESCSEMARS